MKTNPFAIVLGVVFGMGGYLLGMKIGQRQAQNRDAGPLPDASSVPSSTPETANTGESVTEELPK
jgi:hypothetical protein